MCCFSGVVREVSRTRIFARATGGGRQVLAYSMTIAADHEVGMILPLPTADIVDAVDIERTMGLVDPARGCRRWSVDGDRPNEGTFIDDPRTIGAA